MQRTIRVCDEQLLANKLDNLEEMDKFLETYNLLRLNHEELENLNRQITRNEVESVIKKFQTKVQNHTASQVNSTKHLKKT